MNEHKNTILAIVLSLLVVIGWQYFVGYPQMQKEREQQALKQQEQSQQQPSAAQPGAAQPNAAQPASPGAVPSVPGAAAPSTQQAAASRETVLAASPRVAIDTPRLRGSIDLKGGRIDDLSLEQYRETVDPNSPAIVLLSPSGAPDAFYAEFGWVPASGTSTAKCPDRIRSGSGREAAPSASTIR